MKKVVTERPRWGHARTYGEVRSSENSANENYEYEDLPYIRSMSRPYSEKHISKEFSDLIGPIYRFLNRRVGRLWDDVWSEICENLKAGSTLTQHIRDHIYRPGGRGGYVDVAVEVRDGMPYDAQGRKIYYHFYVDPNGVLMRAPNRPPYNREPDPNFRDFGHELKAFKIDGIWYWAVYDTVPNDNIYNYPDGTTDVRISFRNDVLTTTAAPKVRYHKAGERYIASKRQINGHDLKKYGLTND